jgi:hypothetical protein
MSMRRGTPWRDTTHRNASSEARLSGSNNRGFAASGLRPSGGKVGIRQTRESHSHYSFNYVASIDRGVGPAP